MPRLAAGEEYRETFLTNIDGSCSKQTQILALDRGTLRVILALPIPMRGNS